MCPHTCAPENNACRRCRRDAAAWTQLESATVMAHSSSTSTCAAAKRSRYSCWYTNSISCCHVSRRQHTSAYVSIRQHTSAYVSSSVHSSSTRTCAAAKRISILILLVY